MTTVGIIARGGEIGKAKGEGKRRHAGITLAAEQFERCHYIRSGKVIMPRRGTPGGVRTVDPTRGRCSRPDHQSGKNVCAYIHGARAFLEARDACGCDPDSKVGRARTQNALRIMAAVSAPIDGVSAADSYDLTMQCHYRYLPWWVFEAAQERHRRVLAQEDGEMHYACLERL